MKVVAKRNRSDSISAAVRASQASALGPLAPPEHISLREGDLPFWNAIVTARTRDTWTDIDLTAAATLARTQADIEKLQARLDTVGYILGLYAQTLEISRYGDYPQSIPARIASKSIGLRLSLKA